MTRLTMTRKEFARRIGVSERTVDNLIRRREVSFVRIAGRVLFTEEHALELLERNTQSVIRPHRPRLVANG